jgi:hypothetical protein
MGAAAFFAELAGGALGGCIGLGGGVNWAVELADAIGAAGIGAAIGGGGTGAAGTGAVETGAAGDEATGAEAEATGAPFPTGMGLPHFGHFTSVGILAGMALILSFALQFPHSMGINSIPYSFNQFILSCFETPENSNDTGNKQSHFGGK